MALLVPGMPCVLCGKPMTAESEVILLSPFMANRSNPLFVFSDAAIHVACFARHPLSEQAPRWHEEAVRHRNPTARTCAACSEPILDPDDYFGTGLLARDAADPLHEFNFVHLHRSHARDWDRFDEFRRRLDTAQASTDCGMHDDLPGRRSWLESWRSTSWSRVIEPGSWHSTWPWRGSRFGPRGRRSVWRGREAKARGFALLTGSALVFLGLYALTYGASTGLICRQTLDEYIEIGIKAYCLTVGGWLVVWGLQSPPGADATPTARARATSP